MDVVIITDMLGRGGAETQLTRLAKALKVRGWKVGIISMLPPNDFEDELKKAGIPFMLCMEQPSREPFTMAIRMYRQLRRWRPGVVVTFNFYADILGRLCGRLAGVPVIVASLRTAHMKTRLRERIYRYTEFLVDLTASNSKAALDYMLSRELLTPDKTTVIPNGMITLDYPAAISREEARTEFGVPQDVYMWLAVGNLRLAKDYPTLLEATARCAASSRDFRVCIAGGGDLLEDLQAETRARGLEGIVEFLGSCSQKEVTHLLRAANSLVLSSAWEGLPNTVMEAMASGVPVVATQVGGVNELVEPGVSGFIVPPRDPERLADQMRVMMDLDEDARLRMGAAGRQYILDGYENERVVDRWESRFVQLGSTPERPLPSPAPAFVVSLDMELFWGVRDKRSIQTYGENIRGEREAIPAMLELFKKYEVKATWACVGMLLFDRKQDLLQHLPELQPTYARQELDPYRYLQTIGENEREDPYHYGLSLVRRILDYEGMELGSHTFSHFYCLEDGQTTEQFRADLQASIAATERLAARPVSFVFPRNQYKSDYLSVCSELGFRAYRGNETHWMYREARDENQSPLKRGARLLDNYINISGRNGFLLRKEGDLVNCPSSRFLRPHSPSYASLEGIRLHRIKSAMEAAARAGECFHLWWHPHNFGTHLGENLANLEQLLRFHASLRDRYGVVPMTIGETAQAAR
jgi:glycosyltransferase involved in cell wall biosynthesis/peptidoglycan/xylan/chitin deacetylase (PgdA/CDA1 family)